MFISLLLYGFGPIGVDLYKRSSMVSLIFEHDENDDHDNQFHHDVIKMINHDDYNEIWAHWVHLYKRSSMVSLTIKIIINMTMIMIIMIIMIITKMKMIIIIMMKMIIMIIIIIMIIRC